MKKDTCINCGDTLESCENCGYIDCPTCGDWAMDDEGLWFCHLCVKSAKEECEEHPELYNDLD